MKLANDIEKSIKEGEVIKDDIFPIEKQIIKGEQPIKILDKVNTLLSFIKSSKKKQFHDN